MSKAEEDRLWRKIIETDRAISAELATVRKRGEPTAAYLNLKRDLEKLKKEYEAVKRQGTYNPMSLEHGERMTSRKVIGDALGKTGPDSHHGLED